MAAGNVETSSRVADLVLGAFGRALGQGTMNNLTLGDERFSYYETLGGGQGACPDADGPSGVHVAMSNTLNTPDRGARARIPAARRRATRCAAAPAARARHRGGDGVVREIEALREMTFSLIAERRRHAPPGAARRAAGRAWARPARRPSAARQGHRRARRPGRGFRAPARQGHRRAGAGHGRASSRPVGRLAHCGRSEGASK